MATVSKTLADHCGKKHNDLDVCDGPFRIFLGWLLQRTINVTDYDQEDITLAWIFGSEWGIPAFQDAVMRKLVPLIRGNSLSLDAVAVAYNDDYHEGTPLQRAFAAQLAIDIHTEICAVWDREYFGHEGLAENAAFLMDLVEALSSLASRHGSDELTLDVDEFLLNG